MHVKVKEQFVGVTYPLPPYGAQGSHLVSDSFAVESPADPSHWFQDSFFLIPNDIALSILASVSWCVIQELLVGMTGITGFESAVTGSHSASWVPCTFSCCLVVLLVPFPGTCPTSSHSCFVDTKVVVEGADRAWQLS